MKKRHTILFLAAGMLAAALSLSSCEERVGSEGGDFGFSASAVSYTGPGAWTKATPINTVSGFESTYTSFKVSAYKGSTAKFTDKTSSYSAGEWNLNTTAKWYPNETLDFFAVAPANGATLSITPASGTTVASATFSYTASAGDDALISSSEVPDLMFGYYSGQGVLNTTSNKRVAPLTFYHPFTAVRFKAGNIAGATINSIKIKNAAYSGTCTISCSNLATSGNAAISWVNVNSLADYGNTYNETAVQDQQIGTDAQTLMLLPQTMGETAKLEVKLTVNVDGVDKDYTLEASLSNLTFNAGTLYTFTINYADIPLEFTEPDAFIVPYNPTAAVHIDDPTMVAKYAYLPTGPEFNTALKGLATDSGGQITKIVFDRFGSVDDTTPNTIEIQAASPAGEKIYAHYDNGEIIVSTHANTIYLNSDCSAMFKNMTQLTEIQWGNFFESEALTEVREMFMGCSSLHEINLNEFVSSTNTNVTDFSHMFDGCEVATSISRGGLSTVNGTNLSYMFKDCWLITGSPVPNLPMTHPDCRYMYYNCFQLYSTQIDATPSNMDYMYYGCSHLTQFNTYPAFIIDSPEITASHMFENALALAENYYIGYLWRATYDWLVDPANETYLPNDISHIHFLD